MSTEINLPKWNPGPSNPRAEMLAHYARKPANRFIQIDGWTPDLCNDLIGNCGGYGLTSRVTVELMHGASVRILVTPGTDPALVKKILKGAANFYSRVADDIKTDVTQPSIKPITDLKSAAKLIRKEQKFKAKYDKVMKDFAF